ncbi:hypothetical protein CCR75_004367 [Bremia lactucae]|uniref:Uncharacterized protein n=1 Tax=Bremia lactucae TaxID=4779 RepID=A0A976FJS7_BRELC|nr:hypothetical protein CCR75_004367 [Bremia lactucae]
MEEFFQYVGPNGGAASSTRVLLNRVFVYSSPRENRIDRVGKLRVGSYFACSSVLYYEDQVWLKIRRGYFSNAKSNGYIRVFFDSFSGSASTDMNGLPTRQLSSVVTAQPPPFRDMRRLPDFPTYMCARDRLILHQEPVFKLASVSSGFTPTPRHLQRFLSPASVFYATECRFNQDFTQLAIKVSSTGFNGWINTSVFKTLLEVDAPTRDSVFHHGPIYMQNIAGQGGKKTGDLPVRAFPNLQAPKLYHVENFRIIQAIERKLIKDQIWVRIVPFKTQKINEQKTDDLKDPQIEDNRDAWIIERNANTAQRVLVPWGSHSIKDEPATDDKERYYRTVYSRRPLPLRRTAELEAEIVGHLDPGTVFSSTHRILNDKGRMWIRVALPMENSSSSTLDVEDTNNGLKDENECVDDLKPSIQYGYAIQSNAKTNTCMVLEIPAPGKMNPKEYFQVVLPSKGGQMGPESSPSIDTASNRSLTNSLAARVEASDSANIVFYVRNGAIVSAIGTVFDLKQRQMWLQILATELDPTMCLKHDSPLSKIEQNLNVVYLPLCASNQKYTTILKPLYREVTRIENPQADQETRRSPSRVVFSGRASKLFSSHLMRPSTISLPSAFPKSPQGATLGVPSEDGEYSREQSLNHEVTAWKLATRHRMTQVYHQIGTFANYSLNCLRQPFASCLTHQEATRRYQLLNQDEEGMEDYVLEEDGEG